MDIIRELSNYGRSDEEIPWQEPSDLPSELVTAPTMDETLVPEPVKRWALEQSSLTGVPLEMIVVPFISSVAIAIGRRLCIHPKEFDNRWRVTCAVLWCVVVARCGQKKSPSFSTALGPIRKVADSLMKDHFIREKANAAKIKSLKGELKKIDKKLENPEDGQSFNEIKAQHDAIVEELNKLTPNPPRLLAEDATVEKLSVLLNENPMGMGVTFDELMGWIANFDKKGRENSRSFFLKGWGGTESDTVDRISRGHIFVEAVYMVVLGGIQPAKIGPYIDSTIQGKDWDDGLLQRFQLPIVPNIELVCAGEDYKPDRMEQLKVEGIIERIVNWQKDDEGYFHPKAIQFNKKAQKVWNCFALDLEERIKNTDPPLEGFLSKCRSSVPALSLVFESIKVADRMNEVKAVGEDSIELAIRWHHFLYEHAQLLFKQKEIEDYKSTRALANKILDGEVDCGVSIRDLERKSWSCLTKKEAVKAALDTLTDLNWIRVEEVRNSPRGRSSTAIRINPQISAKTRRVSDDKTQQKQQDKIRV